MSKQEKIIGGDLSKSELKLKSREQLSLMKSEFRANYKKLGITTLTIGGIFLLMFFIGKKFLKKKRTKDNDSISYQVVVKNPGKESLIATKIKEHIAIFLLSILKERLFDYMVGKADSKK